MLITRLYRAALRRTSKTLMHPAATDNVFIHENARVVETAWAFVAQNEVPGDYCEFGVFRGRTFRAAAAARDRWRPGAAIHAFDGFSGLPAIGADDRAGAFHEGEFACSREQFVAGLSGVRNYTVTEGWFDASLTPERAAELQLPERQVAIAWIDCDLYSSTVPVLAFLAPLLADGAVLCFDDWYCFKGKPDQGEQRACAEWLAANPELRLIPYRQFHWSGQAFILNRA